MSPADATLRSPIEVTRSSRSSFLVSFAFLSKERRMGISAVYAYCRAVDDAVDEAESRKQGHEQVELWREELARVRHGEARTKIGTALQETVARFEVPHKYLQIILEGVSSDLHDQSFGDISALEGYCYKVASAVGLACLPVFGVHGEAAERYAERLGLALQLTNILRDVRGDAREGRIYLPRDRIAAAGVEIEWLRGTGPAEVYAQGGPVHQLISKMTEVARERFAESAAALPEVQRRALLPAEIMAAIYSQLLGMVEAQGWRLDRPLRLRVSNPRRLMIAARTWLRGRR